MRLRIVFVLLFVRSVSHTKVPVERLEEFPLVRCDLDGLGFFFFLFFFLPAARPIIILFWKILDGTWISKNEVDYHVERAGQQQRQVRSGSGLSAVREAGGRIFITLI